MKNIHTDKAPGVIGPYSQAVTSGELIYCSGQIGIDPKTNELIDTNIKLQTEQVIKNLSAVMTAAGSSLDRVIKTTCYLTDMSTYQIFNEVYGNYFTNKPHGQLLKYPDFQKTHLLK